MESEVVGIGGNIIKKCARKANPDNWKQAVRKRLRQSGQSYINSCGRLVSGREVRVACGITCHLKCTQRLSEEHRQRIHNLFWSLTDEQKNYFYWKYTSRSSPKKRRRSNLSELNDTPPKRAYTFQYRFEIRGELFQVCSKFFYATLDITSKRIYYFYEHCYDEEVCMPREIKRGKNSKPPLPDIEARLDVIRRHIASFPCTRVSRSSKKRCLPANLNITKMYKLYLKSTPNALKRHWYYKVFKEEFNLTFTNTEKQLIDSNDSSTETASIRMEESEVSCSEDEFPYADPNSKMIPSTYSNSESTPANNQT